MFKKMKNRKGFTLIEMMAVIAIVAVLVAVVVPTVGKARIKAQAASDAANLRSISASIATRYVTTTVNDELKEGLEVPPSKLRDSNLILVYKSGNEMFSYYADTLVGASNYRGTIYNGRVAETGIIDEIWDDPEGTIVCVLGAGDYEGLSLAEILVKDFIGNIEKSMTDAKNNITQNESLKGEYLEEYLASFRQDAFKDKYAETYASKVTYKPNYKPINVFGVTVGHYDWYDLNGDNVADDNELFEIDSWGKSALETEAEKRAEAAWKDSSTIGNTDADRAALEAAQEAAKNVTYDEDAANSSVNNRLDQEGNEEALKAGVGAYLEGIGDVIDIAGDTEEGKVITDAIQDAYDELTGNYN